MIHSILYTRFIKVPVFPKKFLWVVDSTMSQRFYRKLLEHRRLNDPEKYSSSSDFPPTLPTI